jgi:hypothetical protein
MTRRLQEDIEHGMNINKQVFLLRAFVVGVLATSIGSYDYNALERTSINVPIWFTTLVFVSHFQIILLFWLAFDAQMKVRNWVVAGFIGSLCYAILFWSFGELISHETAKVLVVLKQLLIGGLSAVPIWVVLKSQFSRAYLWIIANAIGYAFLELYVANINLITGIGVIRNVLDYSFLTLQVVLDGIWMLAYGLLGLILGIFLYRIIENGRIELDVKANA